MYPQQTYTNHPLRDPKHVLGGYRRWEKLRVPVAGQEAEFPAVFQEIKVITKPRNVGRWRPGNPKFGGAVPVEPSRQQLRRAQRKEDNARCKIAAGALRALSLKNLRAQWAANKKAA